jgi:hypothetical protein
MFMAAGLNQKRGPMQSDAPPMRKIIYVDMRRQFAADAAHERRALPFN